MIDKIGLWQFAAGLGLFLFGLGLLEKSLEHLAGRRFKLLIRKQTQSPLRGIFIGTGATALMQSSSVVILMLLAMVGAGIIELRNALGVILGSNLGTTFTGWLVATIGFKVDIESFIFPLIAIGALVSVFFQRYVRFSELGRSLFGFALMFFGLIQMKASMTAFADTFDLSQFADSGVLLFALVGFFLTAIIQSSSATMLITLSALNAQIITLPLAAAIIVGADLGTTSTGLIGSLKGSVEKKQVGLTHFFFNLFTFVVTISILHPLLDFAVHLTGSNRPLISLVTFHTSFNLLAIILFYPLLNPFSRALVKFISNGNKDLDKLLKGQVKTDVPEAAIVFLENQTRQFLNKVTQSNLNAIDIDLSVSKNESLSGLLINFMGIKKSYLSNYEELKEVEGALLQYCYEIQKQQLDTPQSLRLNQTISAIRNGGESSKNIKDIYHNLETFNKSPLEPIHNLYLSFQNEIKDFNRALHKITEDTKPNQIYNQLAQLLYEHHDIYENHLSKIYENFKDHKINVNQIATVLNVNREVYTSGKGLILAWKDLLLTPDLAEGFTEVATKQKPKLLNPTP